MKVFVYGTLKSGYGNNRLLSTSEFVGDHIVTGYKLFNTGFPVATPSAEHSVKGEIWDIGNDTDVLRRLDGLEGEGYMYDRVEVEPDLFMYVGCQRVWNFDRMTECPNTEGVYEWSRAW